jgi:23S rRNA (uracil1939-C5)-methyltransferase
VGRARELSARVVLDVEGPLGVDGAALARDAQGRPVTVVGGLEGERVEATLIHVSGRGRRFARVERVLGARSPDRVPSPCPHFLRCGGCDLLHVSAPRVAQMKAEHVAATLRAAGVEADVAPLAAAPRGDGYRALAKLVVGPGGALGAYAAYSHDVVDLAGCRVHAPVLEAIAAEVRAAIAAEPALAAGLRYVVLRGAILDATPARRVVVTLVAWTADAPVVRALGLALGARADVARVVLHVNAQPGDALLDHAQADEVLVHHAWPEERLGDVVQSLESGAFAQVNPAMAARLYAEAVAWADARGRRALDLYAGSGGLTLTLLAQGAAHVTAVERVPAATAALARAAERLGVEPTRLDVATADVAAWLAAGDAPLPERVIVNPPRRGLGPEVTARLVARGLDTLVYVSCAPDSLARDLAALGPLEAVRAAPFDLFPGTRHVETIVFARRAR